MYCPSMLGWSHLRTKLRHIFFFRTSKFFDIYIKKKRNAKSGWATGPHGSAASAQWTVFQTGHQKERISRAGKRMINKAVGGIKKRKQTGGSLVIVLKRKRRGRKRVIRAKGPPAERRRHRDIFD